MFKKDTGIDLIEKLQRRFTNDYEDLDMPYSDRLAHLNLLPSLELRRLHLDLIICYKVVFGLVCIDSEELFTLRSVSRGHAYKLYKSRYDNTIRRNVFVERVVNVWTSLPCTVDFIPS